jgi:hypothetical protein
MLLRDVSVAFRPNGFSVLYNNLPNPASAMIVACVFCEDNDTID